jgi:hypothetical protein
VTHAIDLLVVMILALAGLVMGAIGFLDGLLAAAMQAVGIPDNAQTVLLAVAAIALIVFAVRALGRVFATLIIVLLVLVLVHKIFPGMQVPQGQTPPWLHLQNQPHIWI